jgi:hypothetical protein
VNYRGRLSLAPLRHDRLQPPPGLLDPRPELRVRVLPEGKKLRVERCRGLGVAGLLLEPGEPLEGGGQEPRVGREQGKPVRALEKAPVVGARRVGLPGRGREVVSWVRSEPKDPRSVDVL